MKAITLHQPWAELVIRGWKEYETRAWVPRIQRPFMLAIHAGKSRVVDGRIRNDRDAHFMHWLHQVGIHDVDKLHYGAMLGICRCTAVYDTGPLLQHLSEQEKVFGNFEPGRFAWRMEVVEVFAQPLLVKGQQGLWEWERL